MNSKKIKFIDLFCGIGGFRLAAENLGLECVFSCDIDPYARQTYETNFKDEPASDVYSVKSREIQNFDILFAGFPCQSFSYSGRGLGFNDKRGILFYEILRILNDKKPKAFLIENVKGLVSHDKGNTLKIIELELKNSGYTINWKVLNSSDFGLPQNRERWYCVGFKDDCEFKFPEPSNQRKILSDILSNVSDETLTISKKWLERLNRHFNSNDERVKHFDFDKKSNRGKQGVYSFLKPDNTIRFHMGDEKKTQIQEGFFTSTKSLSPTLIANRVPQLWDLKRKLSVRECARLQGFPDSFKFPCGTNQSYKQIGNSVSIPVIEAIVKNIIKQLKENKTTYKRRELEKSY